MVHGFTRLKFHIPRMLVIKIMTFSIYVFQVENVSRFLFFMDPSEVSLSFLKDISKMQTFVSQLKMTGLSHQTIAGYIINISRFLLFILKNTNLQVEDPSLAKSLLDFQSNLKDIKKRNNKSVRQEITRKRYFTY